MWEDVGVTVTNVDLCRIKTDAQLAITRLFTYSYFSGSL